MDRRDFLLLRRRGPERVLELSCERLFMQWADARSGAGALEAPEDSGGRPWDGEPPTHVATATPEALLEELDRALAGADVLRLLDRQWLSDAAFAAAVQPKLESFRARGGSIE